MKTRWSKVILLLVAGISATMLTMLTAYASEDPDTTPPSYVAKFNIPHMSYFKVAGGADDAFPTYTITGERATVMPDGSDADVVTTQTNQVYENAAAINLSKGTLNYMRFPNVSGRYVECWFPVNSQTTLIAGGVFIPDMTKIKTTTFKFSFLDSDGYDIIPSKEINATFYTFYCITPNSNKLHFI